MASCFYKRNGITKEAGYGNFQFILLPFFFFLEKKEIRKRQGRYIRTKLCNMDPEHVTSEMEITGSNRESIYCLLHLRLLYYLALSLFTQYWFTLMYQYAVYTVIILGYSSSPYLLSSIVYLGLF